MSPAGRESRPGAQTWIGAILIVAAVAWIYAPAFRGSWLWDDGLEVARNPLVRDPAGWWKAWTGLAAMDYFPLKASLQWLQWHLWGDHVLGYHLTNAALHALAALLIWRVFDRLLGRWSDLSPGRSSVRNSDGAVSGPGRVAPPAFIAWIGALLFAVHPVAVESVAWISEFKNELSLVLLLLAFGAWIRWDVTQASSPAIDMPAGGTPAPLRRQAGTPALPSYSLSLFLFLLAMLSKSSVVMFPFALLLHAWWKRGRIVLRDVLAAAPFLAISFALGLVTIWFQSHRAIGVAGTPAGIGHRLTWAGWSIVLYFRECVVPVGLAPIYAAGGSRTLALLAWVVIVATLGLCWLRREGWGRHALFGLGWFLLFLLPVLGIVPMAYLRVSPRADHLAYVSLVGICGLAAAAIGKILNLQTDFEQGGRGGSCRVVASREDGPQGTLRSVARTAPKSALAEAAPPPNSPSDLPDLPGLPVQNCLGSESYGSTSSRPSRPSCSKTALVCIVLGLAILVLAFRSHAYARVFRSDESLWTYAVRRDPGAWLAHNNLGKIALESGRIAEALAQFQTAVRLEPDSAEAHANLGNALAKSDATEAARTEYETALRLDPGLAGAHYDLGLWYLFSERPADAAEQFRIALRIEPGEATFHNNLGLSLFRLGRTAEAIAAYRRALALSPQLPEAHLNLGNALYHDGKFAEAVTEYREALRENPGYAGAHHNLGYALEALGRYEEARIELDEAERLEAGTSP